MCPAMLNGRCRLHGSGEGFATSMIRSAPRPVGRNRPGRAPDAPRGAREAQLNATPSPKKTAATADKQPKAG